MTVSSQTSSETYLGNGVTTIWDLPFRFFKDEDIQVYLTDPSTSTTTLLVLGTDYTLTGAGLPEQFGTAPGKITTTVPVPNTWVLEVSRVMDIEQLTDIINQGEFFPEIHEDVFDRLTMMMQQTDFGVQRALRMPVGQNYYDAQGRQIKNLGDPSAPQDAATKKYVDDQNSAQDVRIDALSAGLPGTNYAFPWSTTTTQSTKTLTPGFEFASATLYLNGIAQTYGKSFAVAGNQILLAEAIPAGTEVYAILGRSVVPDSNTAPVFLESYSDARSYEGAGLVVYITGNGISGIFYRAPFTPGDVDNGGTVLVSNNGQYTMFRRYESDIDVGWFMAFANGADESDFIQAAIDAASIKSQENQGSDLQALVTNVVFGSGKVYLASVVLKKGVSIDLNGSTIRLPNGKNKTVIEGENYQSLTGTNSGLGVWNYQVLNGTIDGNKDNNNSPAAQSGHGLAVYGRNFLVSNIKVINTFRRGVTLEYGTGAVGTSPFNGKMHKVLVDRTGEHGAYLDVSDMHVDDLNVRSAGQSLNNSFDGIIATKGIRATNINVWRGGDTSITHRYAANLSDGCTVFGAHLETSGSANIVMTGNRSKVHGLLSYNLLGNNHAMVSGSGHSLKMSTHNGGVSGENLNSIGVRLGDSAPAAYCEIEIIGIGIRGGVAEYVNTIGGNRLKASVFLNSDSDPLIVGVPHISDEASIAGTGSGSVNKSYTKIPARNGSVNGVGNTQALAAPLISSVSRAFAASSATNAFLLPKSSGGDSIYVANISSVSIQIFPSSGESILGLAVNAADTIAAGSCKHYVSHSATQWGTY